MNLSSNQLLFQVCVCDRLVNEQMNELNADHSKAPTANEIPSQEKKKKNCTEHLCGWLLLCERVGVNKLGHLVSWSMGMLQQDCFLSICGDPIPVRLVIIVFSPAKRFTQLPHPDQ